MTQVASENIESGWFERLYQAHSALHFVGQNSHLVRFVSSQRLRGDLEPGIYVPTDVPWRPTSGAASVSVGRHVVHLIDPVDPPGSEWTAIFQGDALLWYRNRTGALTPGWNVGGALRGLLLGAGSDTRAPVDVHGREPETESLVVRLGISEKAVLNEYLALIAVAATHLFGEGPSHVDTRGVVLPPSVRLSHDCDNLRGDSLWQQASRARRLLLRSQAGRATRREVLASALRSAVSPRAHYETDVHSFVAAETANGFNSSFYFLVGGRGRTGSRSSETHIKRVASAVPGSHEVGLHYGYETPGRPDVLAHQRGILETYAGGAVVSGRAHYLRLDPHSSFGEWQTAGIALDESVGFSSRLGFRAALAGYYEPLVPGRHHRPLVECPLHVMDIALAHECGRDGALPMVRSLVEYLTVFGGTLTVLFHTGHFRNPEFPELSGVYEELLNLFHGAGLRQHSTAEVLELFAGRPPL